MKPPTFFTQFSLIKTLSHDPHPVSSCRLLQKNLNEPHRSDAQLLNRSTGWHNFSLADMKSVSLFVVVLCIVGLVTGNPYSGEKYYDRDVVRQVAKWVIQAVQNSDLALCNLSPHKRNSEIITSILGLPKNLNDAGRK